MKGRPFLAVLLVVAVLALGLGSGGWWLVWRRGPLGLQHQPLAIPRAARFIPRQAALSLYLLSDGQQPVDYARAVAPLRQRDAAAQAVERLRDGAFAAGGLDYHDELATWLGPEVGLALFDAPDTATPGGSWLLVLSSKDGEGARRFLQRFWQSRSLAGSGLQVSQYRGMGLISGRGGLVGRDPVPLATALVQDDLVLLASGRATLERALDVSQIAELNQEGLSPLRQGVERLGQGVALLVARSGAFGPWLGWPALADAPGSAGPILVGTLQPQRQELVLRGLLQRSGSIGEPPLAPDRPGSPPSPPWASPAKTPGDSPPAVPPLLQSLWGDPSTLALLRNPAALLSDPWLQPLVRLITSPAAGGPLPPLVAANDPGVLLVSNGPRGWLMGTSDQTPRPETLEAPLAAEGLIDAPLDLDGESVTVWTRLEASGGSGGRSAGPDQLRATVAGWRQESEGLAWWGDNLALLDGRPRGRGVQERQRQLDALDAPQAPLRWVLGPEAASALLPRWQPWTILSSVAGGPLAQGLQSLAIAIEPDASGLRWTVRLHFARTSHG
jgi:hypothetical protein